MKSHKWFWITFGAWCFIATVGAWALIFSPFHLFSKKVSEFSVSINGVTENNQIWACEGSLQETVDATSQKWEEDGWKCKTGNLNLASILLGLPAEDQRKLGQIAQLRTFEKNETYRLLGVLNDFADGQSYEWTSEIPKTALQGQDPSEVNFPLKPPANASNIFTVTSEKMGVCTWSLPPSKNPETQFSKAFISQGFNGNLWERQNDELVYILKRGSTKLLGIVETADKKDTISVVKLGEN